MRSGSPTVDDTRSWLGRVAAVSATGRDVLAVDWARTTLGAADGWPVELRTLVQLCLTTRFPMLITWGPDLRMIYNDGYRDMIGDKHPAALGAPLASVWTEVWDVIGPLADHVMRTGEPTWSEQQRLLIDRRGFVEETYFTFSYSPILDAGGVAAGLVDVATETTTEVVAQRRLAALSSLGIATFSASRVTDVCVTATTELARWTDDIVHADVFLRVEEQLVLIASTRQLERAPVDPSLLREVLIDGVRRTVPAPATPADGPPAGIALHLAGDGDGPDGVLYVEPCATLPFTVDHDAFLVEVATTISRALEAAYARTVELGEQRRINETLQQAMLQPASDHPTVAARYRPAALNLAVGGDWYDVVDLDEHRRALVVGDCVGHGLEAATAMGQLRSATRALLLEGHDPATVLERLDVFATSIPGAYATSVVCAVVDRAGATVTYSRAGHVPPLLVGPAGARWLDDAAGALLQVVPDTSRPLARVDYIDGDLLLLYTDGLVERRGETIDNGLARLDAAARRRFDRHVHEIADGLLRDVLPSQRRDDVVLVAKRMVVDTTTPSAA
jgi:hypothetical protein